MRHDRLTSHSVSSLEVRLRAVEDRLEIQALAARFSDAVNERDVQAFTQLWASDRPVWEIGPPLQSRAQGIDEIIAMLRRLLQIERYFMQITHSGVLTIDGDRATARFVERERGRGDGTYYDNLAVYDDVLRSVWIISSWLDRGIELMGTQWRRDRFRKRRKDPQVGIHLEEDEARQVVEELVKYLPTCPPL